MVPPTGPLNLDVEAISGICGSISIACWVVVFSPQILENFRRSSADGLSLQFVIVWLAGDVFNILGAVLQGVLPTMIILAVYYTIADIVLLGQCFYYRGFTWHDEVAAPPKAKKHRRRETRRPSASVEAGPTERTALLAKNDNNGEGGLHHTAHQHHHDDRRGSNWSALSPAVPFVPTLGNHHHHTHAAASASTAPGLSISQPAVPVADTALANGELTPSGHHHHRSRRASATSAWQAAAFNAFSMLMVCTAGVAGWYLSGGSRRRDDDNSGGGGSPDDGNASDPLALNVWGQVFGYLCAVLYLGSRLPQLLLNWRRQSTDGVSMLFFLFACLGNLTYVLSILAYDDGCATGSGSGAGCAPGEGRARYGRYLLVNLSWLAGSLGTLLLDMGIFLQFFLYRQVDEEGADEEDEGSCSRRSSCSSYDDSSSSSGNAGADRDRRTAGDRDEEDGLPRDVRPLLQRSTSSFQS